MGDMYAFHTVLLLLLFFILGAFLEPLSKKIRVPFTLLLVLSGIGLFLVSRTLQGAGGFFGEFIHFFNHFELSPEIVFYVFLPTLIFESSFNLRFSMIQRNLSHISILATIGLLLSSLIITFTLHLLIGMDLLPAFIFGVIISATDPVAVLGTFKEVGAPNRLRTIVEGESLFNDGTALVLFAASLGFILEGKEKFSLFGGAQDMLWMVGGGVLFGLFMGLFFSHVIGLIKENEKVEMTLALVLAHSTFLLAEHLHFSGIIATVIAGVVLGNYGRHKISPSVSETMEHFWDHMAFLVNILIFILIGLSIARTDMLKYWDLALLAIPLVLIARYTSVYLSSIMSNALSKKGDRIPFRWQTIIGHSGLKGALAVVMLLLLPKGFPYFEEIQTMTISVIFFFFLVNATTIAWILRKFGLMKFSAVDTLEIEESHVLVSHSLLQHLEKMRERQYIRTEVYNHIVKIYKKAEEKAGDKIRDLFDKGTFDPAELLLILKKHCLGVERKIFYELFAQEEISENTLGELSTSIDRQRERLSSGVEQEKKKRKTETPFLERLKEQECFWGGCSQWGIFQAWRRRKIILKHERYRSRRISAWHVLEHLKSLKENKLFAENGVLKKVEIMYDRWHKNAIEKQEEIEKLFPDILGKRNLFLAKRNCLIKEEKHISRLFEEGIIPKKVLLELEKSVERRKERIKKDAFAM